ncbi:MAG: PAS domain-containing protein [Candidatus Riflebacteria bacterium]|nr:PAS domain-containing protein [Candidatus Riflebacteria bacterium]
MATKTGKSKTRPAKSTDDCSVVAAPTTAETQRFPVVGIGASAGGLAAFEEFFAAMPTTDEPGMAFVLVQHLAPDHKSILTELIRRYTRMKVFEVENGMEVQINCAYIIPPKCDMALLNGRLQLFEPSSPRGMRLPIDFFFRSLAQDQHERAICIVLSGTGSDGTLGVRAVKGEGGMAMAQTPSTTQYDNMPRNAIATGLIDYELPPAEMPGQLIDYAARIFGRLPRLTSANPPHAENSLKKIFILLRSQTGHDFSHYKPSTIGRRIERRMAVHQIETMEAYTIYLQQTPTEVVALFRDLLIGVTNFFRDPEVFQTLEKQVIPKLFADRPADHVIRVWVAGCSTGEEAYSLAIMLAEHQEINKHFPKIQVFATDIDSQAIATARAGRYPTSIAADVSTERLGRFFSAEPGYEKMEPAIYRVNKNIRDMLIFSEQDVIKDPPFSRLDLISCRNLLIYMDSDLQKKLIPLFHYSLKPGGFLLVGTSESVGDFGELFTTLDRKAKLYQHKTDINYKTLGRFVPPMAQLEMMRPIAANKVVGAAKQTIRELAEQALLQQAVPAAALVTGSGDILYLHGRTGLYLEPVPGEAGVNNIIKMAREGLRQDLTMTLHRAATEKETIYCSGLRVKTNGDFTTVNLTVRLVTNDHTEVRKEPLYLVILEQAKSHEHVPASSDITLSSGDSAEANPLVTALMQELRAKEEYLQTTREELETSNEELKSSNEEMQSINEELQSTNEELETSKEELQSVNEELATVNAELQAKVTDLSRANNDMNNLLAGTGIGTVFVDHSLHIMRFTPAVTRIINLIPSDIGRPVGHIVFNLVGCDTLLADVQAVLNNLVPREMEVQTKTGVWYSMRILPYRTVENVIEGAVITFVEMSAAKQAEIDTQKPETDGGSH